ncbi:MAG: hypothetical protein HWE39_05755 [Oceanospirillaceae bacterium]|nr:hypothetical protein [Oceanospirillaceae bacterium]
MGQQFSGKYRISIDDIADHRRSVVVRAWHKLLQWGLQALEEHNELRRWEEQEGDWSVSRYR